MNPDATASSSSEPQQKRRRTGSFTSNNVAEIQSGGTRFLASPPKRDPKYYMEEDGAECVILVENVLFKIHRFVLSKDSSAFRNMFMLPESGDRSAAPSKEGTDDENPIILSESVDLFRSLLWVLYALPQDLEQLCRTNDHTELIKIATITHKYHFVSTEVWALDALCKIISDDEYMYGTFDDSDTLVPILDVAMLCDHEKLRSALLTFWYDQLSADNNFPAAGAIHAAEKYGLKRLQGIAYYRALIQMETDGEQMVAGLTRDQRIILLSGHWSLTLESAEIRLSAPSFTRCSDCTYHVHGCIRTWRQRWEECNRLDNITPSTDIIEKLLGFYGSLVQDESLQVALTPGCRASALEVLHHLITNVRENLADHFVDRTLPLPPP